MVCATASPKCERPSRGPRRACCGRSAGVTGTVGLTSAIADASEREPIVVRDARRSSGAGVRRRGSTLACGTREGASHACARRPSQRPSWIATQGRDLRPQHQATACPRRQRSNASTAPTRGARHIQVGVTLATARCSSPNESPPSNRVLILPLRSMTNVHGSVRSLHEPPQPATSAPASTPGSRRLKVGARGPSVGRGGRIPRHIRRAATD